MITHIIELLIVFGILALLEWKTLKKSTRSTRYLTCVICGASAAVWIYLSSGTDLFHPSAWLRSVLSSVDPFERG